jgi:hypothetical protein
MSFDNGCLVVKSCSNGVSETLGNHGKRPCFSRWSLLSAGQVDPTVLIPCDVDVGRFVE